MTEQLIGNYRILEQIGAGGMAKVYLAVHKDVPNLRVILKILTDSRLVERFKQEADKLALLDGNQNICRIKHFFNHGDNIVIAMEYIDGVTLDEKIKTDGRLTVAESLRIIKDVLGVLSFAHAKGIYHRDIKPSNIMLDTAGNVKVIDFGIAKAETDPSLTLAGTACGTPPYMAPEQFTPSEDTNYTLVDIYAVGTTLYHMLSGEVPFKGDNEFAIRDAKLFSDPPSLREKTPAVSDQLDKLILKSLSRNPVDRYASANEMIDAVECIRCKEEAKQPTTMVTTDKPARKKASGTLIGAIAGIIVVAAAVVFGLKFLGGSSPAALSPVAPLPGTTVEQNQPILHWNNVGAGTYTLQYANNPDFFIPEVVENITDTFYRVDLNLEDGEHYWRVRADRGEYSPAFSFIVSSAAKTGTLAVTVFPSGDLFIDGQKVESAVSSARHSLDSGQHSVRVVNNSAVTKEFSDNILITPDTTVSLDYTFRMPSATEPPPSKPTPAASLGELKIGSKPTIGADIYIDNKLQSRKTPSAFRLKPGLHVVRAVLVIDGVAQERIDSVTVAAGGSDRIMFDFEN